MKDYKYEVMGVQFNNLLQFEEHFEEVEDLGEEAVYQTKKTFQHREEGLNFDYKYIVSYHITEDGKKYYTLSLAVMPDSFCEEFLKDILESLCFDDVSDVNLYDTYSYGCCTVDFGCEVEESCEEYEINKDILNKIASVYETFDTLRGFYIDKPWNRIGTTGWDTIRHCVNGEELFKF